MSGPLRDSLKALYIPERIKQLPVNDKGYPVPYFVAWIDGKPDFRVVEPNRIRDAVRFNRCWICGQTLGSYRAFVLGPMCVITRVSAEPPSHAECAQFAVSVCPFLVQPKAVRRDANLPEVSAPAGVMLTRNPGAAVVWVTKRYKLARVDNGLLFRLGDPEAFEWYTLGRPASRSEALDAVNSGLPALQEIAQAQGPSAMVELRRALTDALHYLPQMCMLD
ncbi:hypothetical protein B0G84_5695 [Paraburkholderia sp. BL8N3]|nr:hypothetical protein [Paraburkholderia sp. BL8N3]TCK36682.1 hypothetical protein B0G84_5695 [Paraburkholderia sp. BL8N3]